MHQPQHPLSRHEIKPEQSGKYGEGRRLSKEETASMDNTDRVAAARSAIRVQLDDLASIRLQAESSGDYETGFERLRRWKSHTAGVLRRVVHTREGNALEGRQKMSFRIGDPIGNLDDEAKMYAGFLEALDQDLAKHPDDILESASSVNRAPVQAESSATTNTGTVFIVHGHDELNVLRLKDLIRDRWRLEPVVLAAKPGKGRTIIEKFEDEARRAAYAFVLLTPDDVVETHSGSYAQARPNVVFELGWFYGRLGRSRVCILFKKGTHIHSDLDGVLRVQFAESVEEVLVEMERELIEAGAYRRP